MAHGEPELLFYKQSGLDVRAHHIKVTAHRAETMDDKNARDGDLDELVAEIVAEGAVEIPKLDRAGISFERQQRTDRGHDRWGDPYERQRSVLVFDVPFTGDSQVFSIRPSKSDTSPPRAQIVGRALRFTLADEPEPEKVKRALDAELDSVEKYLEWHREMWVGVGDEIAREARRLLETRKEKLGQQQKADEGLASFGFKPKS
jgi:hypothetical protein